MQSYEYKYFPVYYIARKKHENFNISQMIPFEKGKVFKTRKSRINSWASGQKLVPALFCKNDIISGFKIEKFTSSPMSIINSSMGGWLITDPRGFTVDVSNQNIQEILKIASISKGVLDNDAIWGRLGGENWLAIKDSESYLKIIEMKNATENKSKNITAGNSVILKNGKTGVYLGGMYPLIEETDWSSQKKTIKWINKYHFYLMEKGSNLEWKVQGYSNCGILSKSDKEIWSPPLDEEACDEILEKSINGDKDFRMNIGITSKLIKLSKTKSKIKSIFFKISEDQDQDFSYSKKKPYFRDKLTGLVFQLSNQNLFHRFKNGYNIDSIKRYYGATNSVFCKYFLMPSVIDLNGRCNFSSDNGFERAMNEITYNSSEFLDQIVEFVNGEILTL